MMPKFAGLRSQPFAFVWAALPFKFRLLLRNLFARAGGTIVRDAAGKASDWLGNVRMTFEQTIMSFPGRLARFRFLVERLETVGTFASVFAGVGC